MLKKMMFGLAVVCGLMLAGAPAMAQVAPPTLPTLTIDDLTETISAFQTGFLTESGGIAVPNVTQEGLHNAGHVDFDGWYNGSALPFGQSVTYQYNFFEPNSTILSDTLSIQITGEDPAANTGSRDSRVIALFFSDSLVGAISPLAGANTFNLFETGDWQTGIFNGAQFTFRSGVDSVPEPCTMLLLGFGLVGFGAFRKRFKKA